MAQKAKVKSSPKTLNRLIAEDPPLKFLPSLISIAQKYIEPKEIILFGSRARGDHSKNSDVDIAFVVSDDKRDDWPRFVAEVDENLKTLLKLDLVRLDRASDDMKRSIAKEGIIIYG
ncbi:MAG: nucleotidyltransferase domain-containing protein [Proteobacteria bacterium]|nr:nucleotidyltransferase domain-containing protein [Pseudomonadota bacterium]